MEVRGRQEGEKERARKEGRRKGGREGQRDEVCVYISIVVSRQVFQCGSVVGRKEGYTYS